VVALTDRLDGILGGKASKSLDEVFGIRTVDALLRHYPRKYSKGTTVLGEDDEPPEAGLAPHPAAAASADRATPAALTLSRC
jgi:ATP-dependent DNA helicase RecG